MLAAVCKLKQATLDRKSAPVGLAVLNLVLSLSAIFRPGKIKKTARTALAVVSVKYMSSVCDISIRRIISDYPISQIQQPGVRIWTTKKCLRSDTHNTAVRN